MTRRAFDSTGGYDETLAAGEDFDLYYRIKRIGTTKFRSDLVVFESPRRYRKYGYRKVIWDWGKNSLSVFFLNKSISKTWDPVR
jgi:predicted glycosyltransferase involved in capsule biosynthesis